MITAERLRELVHYCPKTGTFTHLESKGRKRAGMRAGYLRNDGYVYIMIGGVRALAHRFAWLYMTDEWPSDEIDHIDGDKANNAFYNLRQVSRQANTENKRQARRNNTTGLLGVSRYRDKFVAAITHSGKRTHLGVFKTAEAAHTAYIKAKRKFHAGCTI